MKASSVPVRAAIPNGACRPMFKHIQTLALILSQAAQLVAAEVSIPFTAPRDGRYSLALYDAEGRMVRTLLTGKPRAKGKHAATWDGLDR